MINDNLKAVLGKLTTKPASNPALVALKNKFTCYFC